MRCLVIEMLVNNSTLSLR